jgi:hypothetical protein
MKYLAIRVSFVAMFLQFRGAGIQWFIFMRNLGASLCLTKSVPVLHQVYRYREKDPQGQQTVRLVSLTVCEKEWKREDGLQKMRG